MQWLVVRTSTSAVKFVKPGSQHWKTVSPVARLPRKAVCPVYWKSHPQARKRPQHVYRKKSRVHCSTMLVRYHTKTSLNWSHNGSKNYTVDSLSRYRCQRPLTNCHTADTARKDGGELTLDLAIFPILLSIKWFQDMTNALFKWLAPL